MTTSEQQKKGKAAEREWLSYLKKHQDFFVATESSEVQDVKCGYDITFDLRQKFRMKLEDRFCEIQLPVAISERRFFLDITTNIGYKPIKTYINKTHTVGIKEKTGNDSIVRKVIVIDNKTQKDKFLNLMFKRYVLALAVSIVPIAA